MSKKLWALGGAGVSMLVLAAAAMVGCAVQADPSPTGGSERPEASSVAEGLTILNADAAIGVSAAFRRGARTIFFESRVGGAKPEGYHEQFPNEPANEMDARFVDQNGHTFQLVIGGDSLIEKSWYADIAKGKLTKNTVAKADRELDFELARAASTELARVLPAQFKDHVYHAVNVTRQLPREIPSLVADMTKFQSEIAAGSPEQAAHGGSANFLRGDLYGKCIYACVGHHSAVIAYNYNYDVGYYDEGVVTCNHGTCANDGSMGYQGTTYSGVLYNWVDLYAVFSGESSQNNVGYTQGQGCQTNYNWNTPPGHLCNDDSAFELQQIKDAASGYGWGNSSLGNGTTFCHKWQVNHWYGNSYYGNSCSCGSGCNNCGGDWSYPPVP